MSTIPIEGMRALVRYPWPGNIRELQNVIERAVILSSGPALTIPVKELEKAATPRTAAAVTASADVITLESAEREAILRALRHSRGRISGPRGAATALGMKRTTLQARMRKLGIAVTDL